MSIALPARLLAQTPNAGAEPLTGLSWNVVYAVNPTGQGPDVGYSVEFFEGRVSRTDIAASAARICASQGLDLRKVSFPPTRDEPTEMRLLGTDLMVVRCR